MTDGKNTYTAAEESLRTDDRQWLIYEAGDGKVGALIRGLEAMALQMTGRMLAKHPINGVRGIGHFMLRVSEARLRTMLKAGGAAAVVVKELSLVMAWLANAKRTPWTPDVARALDELYALTTHVDSRAMAAGITGPGTIREAVRGD